MICVRSAAVSSISVHCLSVLIWFVLVINGDGDKHNEVFVGISASDVTTLRQGKQLPPGAKLQEAPQIDGKK